MSQNQQLIDKILATAKSYIGVTELPGNSGFKQEWFQKLMDAMHWVKGQSWCAYTAKAIWYYSFLEFDPIGATLITKYANGSALQTYLNFAKSKEFHVQQEPVIGGLVVFTDGDGPFGHEGVVTSISSDKLSFTFTSGNTSVAGSREGTTVLDKTRQLHTPYSATGLNIKGFVNPIRIA